MQWQKKEKPTCSSWHVLQGVLSPLVGQMFFRATLFSAFGAAKRWLAKNADGSARELTIADYYKAGAMTGFAAGFVEGPIDFYKSQVQVQIIRSRADPNYKRESVVQSSDRPLSASVGCPRICSLCSVYFSTLSGDWCWYTRGARPETDPYSSPDTSPELQRKQCSLTLLKDDWFC